MANSTQTAILDTFGEMLERLPFEKITITALIRECHISRNTFYYHYPDIYALLDDWLAQELGKYDTENEDWRDNAKALLNTCKAHKKRVYHIFDSISRDRIERYVYSSTDNEIYDFVRARATGKNVSEKRLRAVSDVCRYAIFGYFVRFLWNGMTEDTDSAVDELGALFNEILDSTLTGEK